jgi:hypothetical protein
LGKKWLETMQCVGSLFLLRLGGCNRSIGCFNGKPQFFILRASDLDLLIQGCQGRLRFFQHLLIVSGIDFEKQIAFLDELIVVHCQPDDLAARTWNDPDHVGACVRVIRAWMSFHNSPDVECDQHRAGDDNHSYKFADEFLLIDSAIL